MCWPADTRRWINVGLMLVHRLRHWTNVKPTLLERLVSAGCVCGIKNRCGRSVRQKNRRRDVKIKIENRFRETELLFISVYDSFWTCPRRSVWSVILPIIRNHILVLRCDRRCRDDGPTWGITLFQCGASVDNAGPALKQRYGSACCWRCSTVIKVTVIWLIKYLFYQH